MPNPPPIHHKEVAKFLRDKIGGDVSVITYRDANDSQPIPVGKFLIPKLCFYSTIGAFDMGLKLPNGCYEFSTTGNLSWLPNAIASSIYWLSLRECNSWPLICEDVVKNNVRSTYRHMAYTPSKFNLSVSSGQNIHWLLGVPITDKEIGISNEGVVAKAQTRFPQWLFRS